MSNGRIYQLTPMSCNHCGMCGIQPSESKTYDRYTDETITEATWVCYRCGNIVHRGEVAREKHGNEQS